MNILRPEKPGGKAVRLSRAERNAMAMSVAHLENTLGRRTVQGGGLMIVAHFIKISIQFVSLAVLGRVLLPDDFGLLAMSWAVLGFVTMFAEMGLSTATIQRKEIDQNTTSTLFFVGLTVGLLVCGLLMLLAPLAAALFNEPRLTLVVQAMALVVPINMLSTQHFALLTRTMRWMDIQVSAIVSQLASVAVAISLAVFTPLGYWALVAQAWSGSIVFTAYLLMRCDWRPSIPTNWRAATGSILLGLNLTGFSFLNYFHRSADQVLIGWRWGTVELGYYARAYALLLAPINLVNASIGSALQPALSRLQDKPDQWRRGYLDGLASVVFIGGGITCVLFGGAGPIIEIVYGPGWDGTKTIFGWLALSMLFGTPMSSVAWIYISLGRTNRMFKWGLLSSPIYVTAFVIGLPYGGVGVALAYSAAAALLFLPCFILAIRDTPLTLGDVLSVIWPISAVSLAIGLVLRMSTGHVGDLAGLLMAMFAGLVYLAASIALVLTVPAYASIRRHGLSAVDKVRRRFEDRARSAED